MGRLKTLVGWLRCWGGPLSVGRQGGQDVLDLCDGFAPRAGQGRAGEEMGLEQGEGPVWSGCAGLTSGWWEWPAAVEEGG